MSPCLGGTNHPHHLLLIMHTLGEVLPSSRVTEIQVLWVSTLASRKSHLAATTAIMTVDIPVVVIPGKVIQEIRVDLEVIRVEPVVPRP